MGWSNPLSAADSRSELESSIRSGNTLGAAALVTDSSFRTSPSASAFLSRTSILRPGCSDSNFVSRFASNWAGGFSAAGLNWEGSHTLKICVPSSTSGVVVAIIVGVEVDDLVGTGVGVVREARKGSRDVHPALKNNPAKTIRRKMRDMITN